MRRLRCGTLHSPGVRRFAALSAPQRRVVRRLVIGAGLGMLAVGCGGLYAYGLSVTGRLERDGFVKSTRTTGTGAPVARAQGATVRASGRVLGGETFLPETELQWPEEARGVPHGPALDRLVESMRVGESAAGFAVVPQSGEKIVFEVTVVR